MKKVLPLIICVLVFGTSVYSGSRRLANRDKSGLYARSLEYVLQINERQIDLGRAALLISEQWGELSDDNELQSNCDNK